MSWHDDDLPWSPKEQDAYRRGPLWKRTWQGPSREALWALWGGHDAEGLVECPECGRPHTEPPRAPGFPLCFNCHTENKRPGFHAQAMAAIFPSTAEKGMRETNPLTSGIKAKRLA